MTSRRHPRARARDAPATARARRMRRVDARSSASPVTPREATGREGTERKRVDWDEENLAKNFAERSATMTIDEVETPWHSPPRELFHDTAREDDHRASAREVEERERAHAEVLAKLDALVRADVRGGGVDGVGLDGGGEIARREVRFHDPDAREEDIADEEELTKHRLFEAKRKAFQCKGRATKRFEEDTSS